MNLRLLARWVAVEARVRGALGGSGVLGGGNGQHDGVGRFGVQLAGLPDALRREAVPGRFASCGGMINAAESAEVGVLGEDVQGERGKVASGGGGAVLVGNDLHLGPLAGEAQDGEEEVLTGCAVDPGGAEDNVRSSGSFEGLFAGQF